MPVDAAQALIGEEGAGAAGEGMVDKGGLEEVENGRRLGLDQRGQCRVGLQPLQRRSDVLGVAEGAVKVVDAVCIAHQQRAIPALHKRG